MSGYSKFTNRLRMIFEYYRGKARHAIYPQEVVIELTNHCNLKCVMCPQRKMARPKGFMEEGLFRKIIDEIKDHSELVYLYGTGESLLHKSLVPYTQYASMSGLVTVLSTNGLALTEEVAHGLMNSGLDYLIVALDGGSRETYENIRINGDFDRLVTNIRKLVKIKMKVNSRTKIVIQMIYMMPNAGETEIFKNMFSADERKGIYQFRFKPFYETYAKSDANIKHTRPCYWLWNMMAVAWNGDVQLCCMDYEADFIKSNVREKSISEIWNGELFTSLRGRHRALELDRIALCSGCDIPEQGYFNNFTILGSSLLSANAVRILLPIYERMFLVKTGKVA